jgi:NAD/NADP transhydrogenase alpha subunit
MRSILITAVTVAGLGLVGVSAAAAAPANGAVVRDITTATSSIQDVRMWCRMTHRGFSRRTRECRESSRRWW